ncbi:MAG: site-specific DNA-methyltransferase [Thaumarchaeota archaeon]|nr:site-specific DNA-methyltransferase [Nitrososphaerota archaeon]
MKARSDLNSVSTPSFETNVLFWADCLKVLNSLPENFVDMVYVDPPFFSQRKYGMLKKSRQIEQGFEDIWRGGITSYLVWMKPRLRECHRVLKNSGSVYLHCNWFANAHLRLLMDEIFSSGIRCEIIWDKGFRGTERRRNWQQSHDTIFFYTKTDDYVWNDQHQKYADSGLSRYNKQDKKGKRFARIKRRHSDGTVYYGKTYPNSLGKRINDILRVPVLAATSKERNGYPTQKPEALLEYFIQASTNPCDLVLDPMCGSGTTIATSHRLGRKWIGIDSSRIAWELATDRMQKISGSTDFRAVKF